MPAMLRAVIVIAAFAVLSGCGQKSVPPAVGLSPATAAISLRDADGQACIPLAADGRAATVLLFLMHDCPVANASAPEIVRLAADFTARGVRFFGVYATESAAEITAHRNDYSLPFPGLLDPKLELARLAGATRVPEAAVFSPSGELLYRGRIDDRAVQPGITKPVPQKRDLRVALEAVIAGKSPDPRFTEAIGCYLPVE